MRDMNETPIWTKDALCEYEISVFTNLNKRTGHVPTGDTLRLVYDDGTVITYVVFTGKPMYDYWIDRGSYFESRSSCNDRLVIRKDECIVVEGSQDDDCI